MASVNIFLFLCMFKYFGCGTSLVDLCYEMWEQVSNARYAAALRA